MNVTDTLAPTAATINDLIGIVRQDLVSYYIYFGEIMRPEYFLLRNGLSSTIEDVCDHHFNSALDTFKTWAKDEGYFYNSDNLFNALRTAFKAIELHAWTYRDCPVMKTPAILNLLDGSMKDILAYFESYGENPDPAFVDDTKHLRTER